MKRPALLMVIVLVGTVWAVQRTKAERIGFWRFEETGNLLLDSENGHHATAPSNATSVTDVPTSVPYYSRARRFPGHLNAGAILVPDHDDLDLTEDFTLETWIWRGDYGSSYFLSKH